MRHATMTPIDAVVGFDSAQLGAEPMAELLHGDRRPADPVLEDHRWWGAAKQIEGGSEQDQGWFACEKCGAIQWLKFPVRKGQALGKGKFGVAALAVFQMRLQIDNLPMELQVLRIKLQTARVSPARQPLKKFQAGKPQSVAL